MPRPSARPEGRSPLVIFVRASSLHVGAAAAAAVLREDLTKDHTLSPEDIDTAYAVSRMTPGTNLLALYAVLGHRIGGWPLALQAIVVGACVPASIAVLLAVLYTHQRSPMLSALMTGARAGGVAVLLGSALRLVRPHISARPVAGATLGLITFALAWLLPINLFVLLLAGAATGALLFTRS